MNYIKTYEGFFTRFKKFMNSAPGEFEVEDITDGSFVNDLTSVVRNPIKRSIKKYNNREKKNMVINIKVQNQNKLKNV